MAFLLIHYAELPGIMARMIGPDEVRARMVHLVTVENSLSLGTAGGWSGEEALNAEFDLLKANTDYALVGYHASVACGAVRWRGVDTGNIGLGGPGDPAIPDITGQWFVRLSLQTGLPMIPVFNSANIAGILVDGFQDENGTDTILTTILVELARS